MILFELLQRLKFNFLINKNMKTNKKDSKIKELLNKKINKDLNKSFDLMDQQDKKIFYQLSKLWF